MSTPRKLALVLAVFACWGIAADANDAFWQAARKDDVKTVEALLAAGVDVNTKFLYGATALFYACDRGHVDVVKVLLAKGAGVNVKDTFYGASPITSAVSKGRIEVVQMLREKGATARDDALMSSVFSRKMDVPKVILAAEH